MARVPDYYRILMVPPNASAEEIRQQFRRLATVYHPDQNLRVQEWAAAKMQQLNEAYAALGNETRRRAYDLAVGLTEARPLLSLDGGWAELARMERWTLRLRGLPVRSARALAAFGATALRRARRVAALVAAGGRLLAQFCARRCAGLVARLRTAGRSVAEQPRQALWMREWGAAWHAAGEPPYLVCGAVFYVKRLDGTPVPALLYPLGMLLDGYHLVVGGFLLWFCGRRPWVTLPLAALLGPLMVLVPRWSWGAPLPGGGSSILGDWLAVSLFMLALMGAAHAGFAQLRQRVFGWWMPLAIWGMLSTGIFLASYGQLLLAEAAIAAGLGGATGVGAKWIEEQRGCPDVEEPCMEVKRAG
ncbi:MAG: J domain-containing protein [Thermaerobacter sp.]|nr:J domain-containing protein [Thermaerobacter sp.]